ncbi:uncharacterized protein LOC125875578 [Solanum stenotomum]|uniref:uncharacterized protein LOC125875578 n=1 Tax=Solanum stenotomum TaxID=172797 RepID=UPI0020D0F1A4|nr:uncharacterized protein LOC125875578 [Solanum stenotomum]
MRTLCPNLEKKDGLETVLEVPIPEEMFEKLSSNGNAALQWKNMRNLMRAQTTEKYSSQHVALDQFMFLFKIVGSALVPFQVQSDPTVKLPLKEDSTAKYIVQQYVAACGGQAALNSVNSMCAVGQVKMSTSDMHQSGINDNSKCHCEVGAFVLWQKNPDQWVLELVVSGCKVSAGSNGKVAWSQSSSSSSASKGPPRPLRRFFQGLDPRSTANLFSNAICFGEKTIKDEECFILKLESSIEMLKAQSTINTEVVHHTIWGYFSQRTGLLVQFEDTKLVRLKSTKGDSNVFWETSMESILEDYRYIEGINVAHSGKTAATIYRYGKNIDYRAKIEETWFVEEIDFNIFGLSMECFLPPADLNKETEFEDQAIAC